MYSSFKVFFTLDFQITLLVFQIFCFLQLNSDIDKKLNVNSIAIKKLDVF